MAATKPAHTLKLTRAACNLLRQAAQVAETKDKRLWLGGAELMEHPALDLVPPKAPKVADEARPTPAEAAAMEAWAKRLQTWAEGKVVVGLSQREFDAGKAAIEWLLTTMGKMPKGPAGRELLATFDLLPKD